MSCFQVLYFISRLFRFQLPNFKFKCLISNHFYTYYSDLGWVETCFKEFFQILFFNSQLSRNYSTISHNYLLTSKLEMLNSKSLLYLFQVILGAQKLVLERYLDTIFYLAIILQHPVTIFQLPNLKCLTPNHFKNMFQGVFFFFNQILFFFLSCNISQSSSNFQT